VELTEDWDPDRLGERLNATLHEGFRVRAVRRVPAKIRPIAADVERQVFRIRFAADEVGAEDLSAALAARRAAGEWLVHRESKRRVRTFDVLPMLAESAVTREDGAVDWHLTLTAHEGRWVKPRELVSSLLGRWPDGTRITRVAMGRIVEGRLLTPMDVETP
jgi:hypothetical protein